ncbi:hypothetical protein [Bernardetia sp.]|uniref:hypothetical protein n=1 Tax=Bernardetia sp. TaxID=1937974 RepID=UPI0025BE89D0|nr:hypothetical protein [Bernardetia sp.]
METLFVTIAPHANQFWDPSNKKTKMLVGRGIFEVQSTAVIQQGIASGALSKSSKEEFDRQEAANTEKPVREQKPVEKPKAEDKKPAAKTSSSTTKK